MFAINVDTRCLNTSASSKASSTSRAVFTWFTNIMYRAETVLTQDLRGGTEKLILKYGDIDPNAYPCDNAHANT